MAITHMIFEPLYKLGMWYRHYDSLPTTDRNRKMLRKLRIAFLDRVAVIQNRLQHISEFEFSDKKEKHFKAMKDEKGQWWLYLQHYSKSHFMKYQSFKGPFDLCMAYERRINQ